MRVAPIIIHNQKDSWFPSTLTMTVNNNLSRRDFLSDQGSVADKAVDFHIDFLDGFGRRDCLSTNSR